MSDLEYKNFFEASGIIDTIVPKNYRIESIVDLFDKKSQEISNTFGDMQKYPWV
ncbi:MAG: hypothetical protein M0R46_12515 [Candidatus Muirbacterium halophilum]|nr:hypothetical protein [Candidatus Muirbacterium halophilum]MCK9476740.1 hypothetical protein [Candidatus Muirbacterium halophilum]